jgi:predicted Zn-dependent protease
MKVIAILLCAFAALAADPGAVLDARKARARALLESRDYHAALGEAQALNRDRPDDISGYQLLAAAHLGLGNYTEADAALQWMLDLRIGKTDATGWLLLAQFREITGDVDGAVEAVNTAYARLLPGQDSEGRALLVYAAHVLRISGKLELTEQALKEVLAASPEDAAAIEELAQLRIAQGKRADAARLLRDRIQPAPHPRVLYQLARATADKADYDAFERAARERVSSPDNANVELVLFLAGPGNRPAEALAIARREAGRRRDIFTMNALAAALFAARNTGEAHAVMKDVLAVGTRDPLVLETAARIGLQP